MKASLRISSLLLAGATLLACNDSTVEPVNDPDFAMAGVDRIVEEEIRVFEGDTLYFFCERDGQDIVSEPIALWGQVRERITFTLLPSGGFHASYKVLGNNLRGIGVESGTEYKVTERANSVNNFTTMREGASYRTVFEVSSNKLGKSMRIVDSGKFALNANGELVVERESFKQECNL
ncbi:MAG TPA: hypothetical protein VIL32_03510 [Steroidobacteraceae bacterium]